MYAICSAECIVEEVKRKGCVMKWKKPFPARNALEIIKENPLQTFEIMATNFFSYFFHF